MSFVINELAAGQLLSATMSGSLTREFYESLVLAIERAVANHGRVRVLFVLLGFEGWETCPDWVDVRFGFRHLASVERLAMVGEDRWKQGKSVFCHPFYNARIRYFEHSELRLARQWVEEEMMMNKPL